MDVNTVTMKHTQNNKRMSVTLNS